MGRVHQVVFAALGLAACHGNAAPPLPQDPPADTGVALDARVDRCMPERRADGGCDLDVVIRPTMPAYELLRDAGSDAATPTTQVEEATTLLIDRRTHRAEVLSIEPDASPHDLFETSGDETGRWSSAAALFDPVSARSFVLFYDPIAGGGRYARLAWSSPHEPPRATVLLPDVVLSAGWDHLVPVACASHECQRFVLHDVDTHTATTLDFVWRDGVVTTTQRDIATLGASLKHVWRTGWNREGRSVVTGIGSDGSIGSFEVVTETGRFIRDHDAVAITKGGATSPSVDLACPIAERDGSVARSFLARASGHAHRVRLNASLDAIESDVDLGPLDPYSHAVTLANGATFFYRSVDGSHAFARIEPNATTLSLTRGTLPLAEGLAHVTALERASE